MDRRVKERLVGASILAVLIVLVVPELLSGPVPIAATPRLPVSSPEPVRNVTVDLATSKAPAPSPLDAPAASSAVVSGAAVASSAAPSPTATFTPAPPASAEAASAASTPLEIAPSLPTSSTTTKSIAGHAWAVQLGSFVSRDNADKLARQLRAQGFGVYVLPGGSGPLLRYRVRIGPMPDRSAAAQTVAKLKSLGQVASLVPPGP